MLVHRLLDVVFRTLDAIDAVRARVDRALGTEPQPPSTWPPIADDQASRAAPPASSSASPASSSASPASSSAAPASSSASPASSSAAPASASPSASPTDVGGRRPGAKKAVASRTVTQRPARKAPSSSTPASRPTSSAAGKKRAATKVSPSDAPPERSGRGRKPVVQQRSAAVSAAAAAAGAAARASAASTTTADATSSRPPSSSTTGRKGSVDRSGRDFDSPRARVVEAWLREHQHPIVAEEAALDGKRTLARAVWALAVAAEAGSEQGLTAADASALLWSAAGVEVFSTNVGRTLRDEPALFVETIPDGRSKRYKLTDAGRARLAEVVTR